MGAHFALTMVESVPWAVVAPRLAVATLATSPHAPASLWEVDLREPVLWRFGAEGQGLDVAQVSAGTRWLRIPQHEGVESMNVAAAVAVCLFEQRRQRELSADELSTLMTQAQRETYGDGLQESTLHPYMWAVKGHYYSTGRSFYNYPYMFGQLFGMGLYAIYRNDAANFTDRYDTLLSSTGKGDAATLARTMGIDITQRAFWEGSLAVVADEVAQFEAVVNAKLG